MNPRVLLLPWGADRFVLSYDTVVGSTDIMRRHMVKTLKAINPLLHPFGSFPFSALICIRAKSHWFPAQEKKTWAFIRYFLNITRYDVYLISRLSLLLLSPCTLSLCKFSDSSKGFSKINNTSLNWANRHLDDIKQRKADLRLSECRPARSLRHPVLVQHDSCLGNKCVWKK